MIIILCLFFLNFKYFIFIYTPYVNIYNIYGSYVADSNLQNLSSNNKPTETT